MRVPGGMVAQCSITDRIAPTRPIASRIEAVPTACSTSRSIKLLNALAHRSSASRTRAVSNVRSYSPSG